jgi:hypothetical protein
MKLVLLALLLLIETTALAKFDSKLQYSVTTSDSEGCQSQAVYDWQTPGVIGVASDSTAKHWNLFVRASADRVQQGLLVADATVIDVSSGKVHLAPEKNPRNFSDGTRIYHFKVPYFKRKPKGKEVQRINVVLTLKVKTDIYDFATQIAIVNNQSEVRSYHRDLACARSLPPIIIREKVTAPPVAHIPQDVQFNYEFSNEFEIRNSRLSGIVSLGFFRQISSVGNLGVGGPSASLEFNTTREYAQNRRSSTVVSHTFKIRPNTIGYIVGTHTEHWVPYRDVTFNSCGRMDMRSKNFSWESRILPAFAMLVTEPEHEGNFDYLESKLDEYQKFNTCKERF